MMIPLRMGQYLAGPEYGSIFNIADASSSNLEASSTRCKAEGMSCFRIESSLLFIVSRPTLNRQ